MGWISATEPGVSPYTGIYTGMDYNTEPEVKRLSLAEMQEQDEKMWEIVLSVFEKAKTEEGALEHLFSRYGHFRAEDREKVFWSEDSNKKFAAMIEQFRRDLLKAWLEQNRDKKLSGFRRYKSSTSPATFDGSVGCMSGDGGPHREAKRTPLRLVLMRWDQSQPAEEPRTGADFLNALAAIEAGLPIMVEGESYDFPVVEISLIYGKKGDWPVAKVVVNGKLFPVYYDATQGGPYGAWVLGNLPKDREEQYKRR